MASSFQVQTRVPSLLRTDVKNVLLALDVADGKDQFALTKLLKLLPVSVGIKKLMMVIEMARSRQELGMLLFGWSINIFLR